MDKKEPSYFEARMRLLGVTPKNNKVQLWEYNAEKKDNQLTDFPVFTRGDKGIDITVYDLDRSPIQFKPDGSRWSKKFIVTRLEKPETDKNGKEKKYNIPKGGGTHPFFPPLLVDKYDKKEVIETLVITEGYFKAFKGSIHGIDVFGLSSITHYKDAKAQTLHQDIIKLIIRCKVKNIVLLYDGDCRNISHNALAEGKDIYNRPSGFFNSAKNIRDLLKDYLKEHQIDIYFSHIKTDEIDGDPKGLDDLLCALPDNVKDIASDIQKFSGPGQYFWRKNITHGLGDVQKHLKIDGVNSFYDFHADVIKEKEFVYYGTKYKRNPDKSECEVIIPGAAKHYFRVGDSYYEKLEIPNKYSQLQKTYHRRDKTTISDDHTKNFLKHIPKYKAFCNVPDHENWQEVIYSCYNIYFPFEHRIDEGDCKSSIDFVKHIFGDDEITWTEEVIKDGEKSHVKKKAKRYELGLDYITILYKNPIQTLPILCLVSKENGTGKSTFAKWMKSIFTQNMAFLSNSDLGNDFNSFWATKLIACCEETLIDKQLIIEKIKTLSTADKIALNAKGRDQVEVDCFLKFILCSNNEEKFVYASEDDIRYWVLKVPLPKKEKNILPDLNEEIPAFLHFLSTRQMVTQNTGSRMWFTREQLITEALKKVMLASQSTVERELRSRLRDMFLDFQQEEIHMTVMDIWISFFNKKFEKNYIEKVISEKMKCQTFRNEQGKSVTKRYRYPKWERVMDNSTGQYKEDLVYVTGNGRPFVFKRNDFVSEKEVSEHEVAPELLAQIKSLSVKNETEEKLPF